MTTRLDHLESLLRFNRPVEDSLCALKAFGWDSEEELVVLTRGHLRNVLQRFLANEIKHTDVEQWADAIEGRDDIGVDEEAHNTLLEAIFELANPSINGPLTTEKAQQWLALLE